MTDEIDVLKLATVANLQGIIDVLEGEGFTITFDKLKDGDYTIRIRRRRPSTTSPRRESGKTACAS